MNQAPNGRMWPNEHPVMKNLKNKYGKIAQDCEYLWQDNFTSGGRKKEGEFSSLHSKPKRKNDLVD